MIPALILTTVLAVDPWQADLIQNINCFRDSPLVHSQELENAAQYHANFLARTGLEGHEGNGEIERRIMMFGFKGTIRGPVTKVVRGWKHFGLGEVVACGQPTCEIAMWCWIVKSPKHREALLEKSYDSVGFAYAEFRGRSIWVGCLGKANK